MYITQFRIKNCEFGVRDKLINRYVFIECVFPNTGIGGNAQPVSASPLEFCVSLISHSWLTCNISAGLKLAFLISARFHVYGESL